MTTKTPFRQSLLLRVYLFGLLLLALSFAASFLVGTYVVRPLLEAPTRPSTTWIARHLSDLVDQPQQLKSELDDLRRRSNVQMTLFDVDGRVLASNAKLPVVPLDLTAARRSAGKTSYFVGNVGVIAINDSLGDRVRYVRVTYPDEDLLWSIIMSQLAVALLVLAAVSMPLARSLIAPVNHLTTLTRAFGAGELAVRARTARRDELGQLLDAFDEMADRIAQLRLAEKELLANISHELRTPLARIRLAIELASDGDVALARGYIVDIEDDLAELERLLDDVMTTARLAIVHGVAGDPLPPLQRQHVDVAELLAAARLRFARRFPGRILETSCAEDLPHLDADPNLLRRVLDNLLDNAVKYSDAKVEMFARSQPESNEVQIEVLDEGMGIASEDLERVFEPFFRGDRSRNRRTGGVGLGLAVVRRVLEAHGGRIEVTSQPSIRTRFLVRLPGAALTQRPARKPETGTVGRVE